MIHPEMPGAVYNVALQLCCCNLSAVSIEIVLGCKPVSSDSMFESYHFDHVSYSEACSL